MKKFFYILVVLFITNSLIANEIKEDKYKLYTEQFMNNCANDDGTESKKELEKIRKICECAWNKAKTKFSIKDLENINSNDESNPKAKLLLDYLELNLENCLEKVSKK